MKRRKELLLKPDLTGLVDPLEEDLSVQPVVTPDLPDEEPGTFDCHPESVVWARMVGYKPSWSPAVVSFIAPETEGVRNRFFVFFIEESSFGNSERGSENSSPSSNSDSVPRMLPKWFLEEQAAARRDSSDHIPPNVKYAWIAGSDIRPWEGDHKDGMIKAIAKLDARKRGMYQRAVACGDRMHERPESVPKFVGLDTHYRRAVYGHTQSVATELDTVRPALKMAHLKLFLECNMMELHWRTIAYARLFVRAVQDEIFGGYHLIAAQDWPTDKQVEAGVPDVFLIYAGTVLTEQEAVALETEDACMQGVHEDRNRYVAEIPNTASILDKSGKHNINYTNRNLFVDGLKYADPESPLWAPGPTVNHERVKYCKLEPHHVSGTESIRGFWLQRKRGEVITKGEPLFWSYDCGAGKFDSDFGLDKPGVPPPIGWKSTSSILSDTSSKSRH